MTQQDDIRKAFFEEGLNVSQIAETLNVDRKTVRKYIHKEDWNQEKPQLEHDEKFPILDPYKPDIDQWLKEDKQAKVKQRHTAVRVFDRLCVKYKADFKCSYRTVAKYVAFKKKELYQKNTCRLPLQHIPGEAQVDFGKADFYERGHRYEGAYLNVSFPNSNGGYTQLFKGENHECLFQGLKNIFEHIGGVPYRLWFDNASTIVKAILKEGNRNLTDSFLRFKQHYGFEAAFCNPASGHEKGSVESKVGYHRRNFLVPIPHFDSIEEFNRELLSRCDLDMQREHYRKEIPIATLFEDDRKAFLPLPSVPYDVCEFMTVRTNTYAKFSLQGGKHLYSTVPKYANSRVLIKTNAYEVIVLDESHREIVRHQRLYGETKQESMQWLPYLTQLSRSPGAFKYSGIYTMLPDPLKEYLEKMSKSDRGKILRVMATLCEKSDFEQAVQTIAQALEYGVRDGDSLIALHSHLTGTIPALPSVKLPENIPNLSAFSFNVKAYDEILKKGGAKVC